MSYPGDVTPAYVDLLSNDKYATRTADTPEFDALKSMYGQYINANNFPDKKATHGLSLLICHHYALDNTKLPDVGKPDTTVGPVTTERVGDLTQVRGLQPYIGTIKGNDTYLTQTKYGIEFLYLMKTFKPTPIVL
jgi:hypothetical protein